MSRPAVETVEILRGRDSFAVEIRQGIFWQGQYLKTTEAAPRFPTKRPRSGCARSLKA